MNILATIGSVQSPWEWCLAVLSIVLIDLVLAGDNAVVIALAVRHLSPQEKLKGIILGASAAVILRVGLTFVASQLLLLHFVKLIGGALILWIAVKLLLQNSDEEASHNKEFKGFWQAVGFIVVADITMSLDNVLAVAGASKGHFGLLLFGLALSIPMVVFASHLISKWMEKYPIIISIGAAILGKVGAEMMLTDPFIKGFIHPPTWMHYAVMVVGAVGVLLYAEWVKYSRKKLQLES